MAASFVALGTQHGGTAASVAKYFTKYHTEGFDPPGIWFGAAAKKLGLDGDVNFKSLYRMLLGTNPTKSDFEPLDQTSKRSRNRRRKKTPNNPEPQKQCLGVDITFSPPKTLSVLWAVAGPKTRAHLEQALLNANAQALEWVEKNTSLARRGKAGHIRERAKLIVASFMDFTNREDTPQVHIHNLFGPRVLREDGTWGALNTIELRNITRALGPVIRCILASELVRLGFELERGIDRNGNAAGWFEIKGVPKTLAEHWSPRRAQIERFLETSGQSLNNVTAQVKAKATLKTRGKKQTLPPREDLFDRWSAEARSFGFTSSMAEKLRQAMQAREVDHTSSYKAAQKEALNIIMSSQAHFTFYELLQHTCEALSAIGISGIDIASRLQKDLNENPQIVSLGKYQGNEHYTTRWMWNLEKKLVDDVREMKECDGASVPLKVIQKVIQKHKLEPEQAEAAEELTTAKGAVRCLTGVAGSGKTQTLTAVKEAFECRGYRVIGGAIAGAMKEELASRTGMETRTVASYLWHLDKHPVQQKASHRDVNFKQIIKAIRDRLVPPVSLQKNTVLVIDEAGQLDNHMMGRLIHHAKKSGATIILAGDDKQLNPIKAGAPFRKIATSTHDAFLSENRRQKQQPEDRDAAQLIREGRASEALKSYAERGRLVIGKDRQTTMRQIVSAWVEEGGLTRPKDCVIFTHTRDDSRIINEMCQKERKRAGHVRTLGMSFKGQNFCVGDRVIFHESVLSKGIQNGYTGTVVALSPLTKHITVRLDRKPTSKEQLRGRRQTVKVALKDFEDRGIGLFYAGTSHKLQGQGVEKAFLLLGGRMTDREMTYVQATRGRQLTKLFVDEDNAGKGLSTLTNAVARSRAKKMAHEIAEDAGLKPSQLGIDRGIQR